MRFIWDPRKAASNVKKHGVGFPEAVTAFADPLARPSKTRFTSNGHSSSAKSAAQRILVTVFVELDQNETRIISARKATRRERRIYETGEDEA